MEPDCLIDTNAIIEFLNGDLPENGNKFLSSLKPKISVITTIELLSWPDAREDEIILLGNFVNDCKVYHLNEPVIGKAIELRTYKRLKIGDAIIAATALTYNLSLITRNVKDFKSIDKLLIIDLHHI